MSEPLGNHVEQGPTQQCSCGKGYQGQQHTIQCLATDHDAQTAHHGDGAHQEAAGDHVDQRIQMN